MTAYTIEQADAAQLQAAQAFYDANGYQGSPIQSADRIALAWSQAAIIGIARLCIEQQAYLCLRGMRVHPEYQRQGISLAILKIMTQWMGTQACYCLPYTHVVDFYRRVGFETLSEGALPEYLQERVAQYRKNGLRFSPWSVILSYRYKAFACGGLCIAKAR